VNLQSDLYTHFDSDPAPITAFLQWLATSYHLPNDLKVLDIGCGPGRMLREFAALGWETVGLEPDADFYSSARLLTRANPAIRVRKGGFFDLEEENAFDLITAINDPFHYLLDVAERVEALERLYKALRPGGVLFLEMTNFLVKLREYEDRTTEIRMIDGRRVIHHMRHDVDSAASQWLHYDEYLIEGQETPIKKLHRLAIIPLSEVLYFIQQQGFLDVKTFSGYDSRQEETPDGKYMLITARKPAVLASVGIIEAVTSSAPNAQVLCVNVAQDDFQVKEA
jgi:SAM-dependent methyltransferase